MENRLNLDFLKIEFRKLYTEVNNIFDYKGKDIIIHFKSIVEYIILLIYEKNKILYDDKVGLNENITRLYNKGILPGKIYRNIILVLSQINICYQCKNDEDETEWFEGFIDKYKDRLYEILVFVAVKCGEENYSLILSGLNEEEKNIFKQYLNNKESNIIDDKDEEKGLVLYEDAANMEDIDSDEVKEKVSKLVEAGENYYLGRGVQKNNKEAFKNFIEAAKYDSEVAEAYLGLFYERGLSVERNYDLANKWYRRAAAKGNSFAQYSLGCLYLNGTGVARDYQKALICFGKSSESEYSPAYYQLGRMYYNGYGVDKNLEFAFKWYKKAAEENLPAAQHALSYMYKTGEGCERNIVRAYYWVEKAAENDYEDAYYIVGKSYLEGICYEVNYEKAYYYLKKGYEAYDTDCIESLADMYYSGLYVDKDVSKALDLYNRSIECGNRNIFFKVGKIYEDENLIDEAIDLYDMGSREGDLKCIQRLGIMYYNGELVKRDTEKAIKYIEIAAENKAPHAMYMLAIAYLRVNKFGEDTTRIVKKLLEEAYELKSQFAAEYLAFLMLADKKDGKDINEKKLLEYLEFGFANGVVGSSFQYGYIYENGIVVEKNLEKAYSYYKMAADRDYIKAIVKLASWYKIGKFLPQDINESIKLYTKAAEHNDIEAIESLIEIYELGFGNSKSDIKALKYVFKLIELDALKGKCKLAYYCLAGIGVEKDEKRANEIIKEIEDIDKGTANNLRCILAEKRLITNMSQDEIINTYMEGIDLGNSDCYGNLALYLYNNNLYKDKKYEEYFKSAMAGKDLGIKKCNYVYLKDILKKKEENSIVTEEEMRVVKDLRDMIDKGMYEAINDLLEWYDIRDKTDDKNYYELKKQAIFYNITRPKQKHKKKLSRQETLNVITIVSVFMLIIIMIYAIVK